VLPNPPGPCVIVQLPDSPVVVHVKSGELRVSPSASFAPVTSTSTRTPAAGDEPSFTVQTNVWLLPTGLLSVSGSQLSD
jgi:hypothetical protein